MDVTRHRYAVEGWGVGEIVVRDEVLVEPTFFPSRGAGPPPSRGGPPGGSEHPLRSR